MRSFIQKKPQHNKNIISLASSLGQLLTGWRFAQYSQQVIAPYVKRYVLKIGLH
jgi:hypothetical protein